MTITNGASHQSVDDILASIRTTNGDQNLSPRLNPANPTSRPNVMGGAPLNPSTSLMKRDQFAAEDASDFELPAIFKPGHQSAPERPNLLGRITDALKPAAAEPERSRTVIRFEQAAANRMLEPPRAAASAPTPLQPVNNDPENVKRQVPSFFDTRMSRMAEMSRPEPPPPPAPINHADEVPGMDDAAAQLLRPILKQWLSENMPKIVEKALRSEAGEDLSGGFDPTPPPRKTLR